MRWNLKEKMNKIKAYLEDASNELFHKVSWPTWSELQSSSVVVMIASVIIAILVFGMDRSFNFIMEQFYHIFQ
ncbi:MAG TPA: preprotein translocase subunit SecE [Bacteroidia bacterium]|nr:preprotein translocase subunit SecE [Bacteroidia bacterium]